MGSRCCEWFFKLSIKDWSMDLVIWRIKFALGCLLQIFVYFNSKSKATCKKRGLWMPVHQSSFRRLSIKIPDVTFAIQFFSHQNALTKLQMWVLCNLLLLMMHQICSNMVYSSPTNSSISYVFFTHLGGLEIVILLVVFYMRTTILQFQNSGL